MTVYRIEHTDSRLGPYRHDWERFDAPQYWWKMSYIRPLHEAISREIMDERVPDVLIRVADHYKCGFGSVDDLMNIFADDIYKLYEHGFTITIIEADDAYDLRDQVIFSESETLVRKDLSLKEAIKLYENWITL